MYGAMYPFAKNITSGLVLTCPGHWRSCDAMTSMAFVRSLSATSFLVKGLSLGSLLYQSFADRCQKSSACSSDIRAGIDFFDSSLFVVDSWDSARSWAE